MASKTSPTQSVVPIETDDVVPPMVAASQRAFERDVENLLPRYAGKWVAYHGDECLGMAATQTELYERGFRLGLRRDEFVVRGIEPITDDCDTGFGFL